MRFFPKPPPVPKLARRAPRPWDQPETEFPGIVPLDSLQFDRSERAAIAITGISAYSTGFEIFVTRLIRPGAPGLDADPVPGAPRAMPPIAGRSFQISLQLADGSEVVGGRPRGDAEPTGPILTPRGGGGTSHYQLMRWWAWPLPPSGPLEFICQWPMFGIAETRVGVDAQLILDASQRSVQVWPGGED
ncbi:MAG: hypothetical protein ACRDNT_04510 [Streptosporangiaceae bacterium]